MNIAVIGAGAIGSTVAAYLHKAGLPVVLVGKEDQVLAINTHGLSVTGVRGDEVLSVRALTRLDKEYDLVIFATKTQDLEAAYQANNEFLEECYVLSSQNGVQADNILGSHFEREKMFSSIVMFGATYIKPGHLVFNFEGDWILGRPFTSIDPKMHQVADELKKAFNVVVTQELPGMKWLKLFVNFNNCIPALIGRSMQETFADMDFCRLSILLLKEGVDIIKEAGIELVDLPNFPAQRVYGLASMPIEQAAGIINQTLTTLSKEPLYGSILQSIMRGRTSEIEFINGEITQMATQIKTEVPLNRLVVDLVHEVEKTGNYFSVDEIKDRFARIYAE